MTGGNNDEGEDEYLKDENEIKLSNNQVLRTNIYQQKIVMTNNPLVEMFGDFHPYGVWKKV